MYQTAVEYKVPIFFQQEEWQNEKWMNNEESEETIYIQVKSSKYYNVIPVSGDC